MLQCSQSSSTVLRENEVWIHVQRGSLCEHLGGYTICDDATRTKPGGQQGAVARKGGAV